MTGLVRASKLNKALIFHNANSSSIHKVKESEGRGWSCGGRGRAGEISAQTGAGLREGGLWFWLEC